MGDILEISTAAFLPLLYYKASGNGLWFDIKTHSRAFVGFSEDCEKIDYRFEFENPGAIAFSKRYESGIRKTGLPFTLSEDEYTRFWVAWDCKSVWAGIGYTSNVVLSCPYSSQLNYVTFSTRDSIHPCSFKFAVPPLCLRIPAVPSEPKITAGKLQWKQCDGQLPDEAVIGGHIDGEVVYIVRAHHRRSLTPGVFIPSQGLAFIPWGGSDNPTPNFEALCGFNLKWVAGSYNKIPVDAFIAGYSEVNREPLFIGRAISHNNKIPGKIQLSQNVCYITEQGRTKSVNKFEVLTEPGRNVHCANKYIVVWNEWRTYPPIDNDNYLHRSEDEDDDYEVDEDEDEFDYDNDII